MTRSVSGVYDIRVSRVDPCFPSRRDYRTSSVVHHGGPHIDKSSSKLINIHWIKDGTNGELQKITTSAHVGETLLQVAHHHEIEVRKEKECSYAGGVADDNKMICKYK